MNKITDEQFNAFLADNKLDFTVAMKPQHIMVPPTDDEGNICWDLPEKQLTIGYCPVRTDTMQPLSNGGMSENFHPIQNRDAFSVIPALSNVRDINLIKANLWGGGAGVYAQISLGGMQIGDASKEDYVGKYLSVVNSHDGSQSLRILITPYRFFCKNQIAPAIHNAKEGTTMINIRHNASASDKLEQLIEHMKIVDDVFQRTEDVYQGLAGKQITADYVEEVISRMYPRLPDDATLRMQNTRNRKIDATLQRFNNADGLRDEQRYYDIQQDPSVFNAWNLYNAVQGVIQHESKDTITKEKSVLMGAIAEKSASALALVTEVCSSQHVPQFVLSEIDALTQ